MIKALFLSSLPIKNHEFQRRVNAFIIFCLRFKDDDDEFQRRVNAFIIFGLSKQFKDDDYEFQRRVNAFIIFGLRFKDDVRLRSERIKRVREKVRWNPARSMRETC